MKRGETLDNFVLWSCPWCSSSKLDIRQVTNGEQHFVICEKCGTSGPWHTKRFDAMKAWNCLAERIARART